MASNFVSRHVYSDNLTMPYTTSICDLQYPLPTSNIAGIRMLDLVTGLSGLDTLNDSTLFLKTDEESFSGFSDTTGPLKLSISEHRLMSDTPSDVQEHIVSPTTSESSIDIPAPKKGKRRGRPPNPIEPGCTRNSKRRIAHNMVERRYRDTLNLELEKLGKAVPCIAELDCDSGPGRSRASKATVLASAVAYIKRLEARVEELSATR